MRILPILALVAAGSLPAADARPLLHPLFSDHAVVQRGKPLAVWGWTKPGAAVTVALTGTGGDAAPATVTAGADGHWRARLGPYPACSTPCVLEVRSEGRTAAATDLLVGEVWLCSGQSNMEMTVKGCNDAEAEARNATFPAIRHLTVLKTQEAQPIELIKGAWKICAPGTVPDFTAVGYFFGRELHRALSVPIGLVHASWGGTSAVAWTSQEALARLPEHARTVADFRKLVADCLAQKARTGKDYPQLIAAWYPSEDPGSAPAGDGTAAWAATACDETGWSSARIPGALEDQQAIPATWDGTAWLRLHVSIPAALAGRPGKLSLGRIDDWDTAFVNGRQVGTTEHSWAAHAYDVPGKLLGAGDNVIAIRIMDLEGKAVAEGRPEDYQLRLDGAEPIALAGTWKAHPGVERAKAAPMPVRHPRAIGPGMLFNGMIAPLVPMSLAGAIWYQGETDVARPYPYANLLQAMIRDWRDRFDQGDLPFHIVQLANFMEPARYAGESAWAEVRDAQAVTAASVPGCGLAVAIDIGEAKNIHPRNKQEVGRRLALQALARTYGRDVQASGPVYRALSVEGGGIRLAFDQLGGGLMVRGGGELTGFTISGADRTWQWAKARIDGDSVLVSAPEVAKPVAARYGWSHNPGCNLESRAGLPAVPFRTDDWPGGNWGAKPAR